MNKTSLFLFALIVSMFLAGCSNSQNIQSIDKLSTENLVQITPEEWEEISKAEEYCRALDYFDATGEIENKIMECQKKELGSKLWDKLEKWQKQDSERWEAGAEEREKERLAIEEENKQRDKLKLEFEELRKAEFQTCVAEICKGNEQCFKCRDFLNRYVLKKFVKDNDAMCKDFYYIEDCDYIKDKTEEQLKQEMITGFSS